MRGRDERSEGTVSSHREEARPVHGAGRPSLMGRELLLRTRPATCFLSTASIAYPCASSRFDDKTGGSSGRRIRSCTACSMVRHRRQSSDSVNLLATMEVDRVVTYQWRSVVAASSNALEVCPSGTPAMIFPEHTPTALSMWPSQNSGARQVRRTDLNLRDSPRTDLNLRDRPRSVASGR